MTRKRRAYIAGGMRGYPNLQFEEFDRVRDALLAEGFSVVSPADMDRAEGIDPNDPDTYEKFTDDMRRDLEALVECDVIVFLKRWEESVGARMEATVGLICGHVFYRAPDGQLGRVCLSRDYVRKVVGAFWKAAA
jgi:hypothetical protein